MQQSYYNITKRRIFFWTLVLLFWTITPSIISYAFGYRYSFDRGIFVYAGSITIKANPQRVNIKINNQDAPQSRLNYLNNSYHIDGLYPGEYIVEASLPGYSSWSKKVSVRSGKSTEFWNALLTRDLYTATEFNTENIQRFFLSPKQGLLAYYSQNEENFSVHTINTKDNTTKQLLTSQDCSYNTKNKENIEWSPKADRLSIPVICSSPAAIAKDPSQQDNSNTTTEVASVDAGENNETQLIPLDGLEKPTPENQSFVDYIFTEVNGSLDQYERLSSYTKKEVMHSLRWSSYNPNIAYYLSENNLYLFDQSTKKETQIESDVAAFDISYNAITFIRGSNSILYKSDLSGTNIEQLSPTPLQEATIPSTTKIQLTVYNEQSIAVLIGTDLFVYNKNKPDENAKHLASDVKDIQFSNDGKKLLFWDDKSISVYFFHAWEVQPQRNQDTVLRVAKFFDPIDHAHWSKDYEHVIYTQKSDIKIIELDQRDKQNIHRIHALSAQTEHQVFSDTGDNKIYFIDKKANDCCEQLYSIDFPEEVGILNF